MSKRLIHPKGPSNMLPAFSLPILENGKPRLKRFQGFTGFKGWRYHPTRGFKKVEGYVPTFKGDVLKEHSTLNEPALLSGSEVEE
jgi:hypothetical protein